ncbi:uncharacterized protein LOC111750332 isoform X4 [Loxodonta africana]|uniref:uncharacterized protein LOC111750332 isoform X4 n=1 Tax=Loxodonta africana TaxID=9785 RepID=UPI0030D0FC8E
MDVPGERKEESSGGLVSWDTWKNDSQTTSSKNIPSSSLSSTTSTTTVLQTGELRPEMALSALPLAACGNKMPFVCGGGGGAAGPTGCQAGSCCCCFLLLSHSSRQALGTVSRR